LSKGILDMGKETRHPVRKGLSLEQVWGGRKNLTPANAVLTTFFEPWDQVGTYVLASGFLLP